MPRCRRRRSAKSCRRSARCWRSRLRLAASALHAAAHAPTGRSDGGERLGAVLRGWMRGRKAQNGIYRSIYAAQERMANQRSKRIGYIMPMKQNDLLRNLTERCSIAVAHYWKTRQGQRDKQKQTGKADQGLRSAVTGGAQMDGFIDLFTELITDSGISELHVFRKKAVELPGFFRPTKEWDLLVVREETRFWLPLRRSRRSAHPLATTSTIALKRRWEAPLICGLPTGSTPI